LLRNNLRSFLADRYSFESRRAASRAGAGWRPEIWKYFAVELGLLSLSLPERAGGLGVDFVSTMVVMEELGRALVIEPYLESIVICGGLLSAAGGARADRVLAGLGRGEEVGTFAWAEADSRYDFAAVSAVASRTAAAGDWTESRAS
jgi:alkylation response protein AidB-like acyl-CoA dehydrogenase